MINTKLNAANKVPLPKDVANALQKGHELIGDLVPAPFGDGFLTIDQVKDIVHLLTKFNEGGLGVSSCPEDILSTASHSTASHPTLVTSPSPVPSGYPNGNTRATQGQTSAYSTNQPDDSYPEQQTNSGLRRGTVFSLFFRRR